MEIRWTETALSDLNGIYEFISQDSFVYAGRVADNLLKAADRISTFPKIGRRIPEFDDDRVREVLVGPHRIMYSIGDSFVHIVTIIHGSRDVLRHVSNDDFVFDE
jgi:plasmid stabilization system protein ParE